VDAFRDLGRTEPWQDSVERSLARRSKSGRASVKCDQRREERDAARRTSVRRPASDRLRTGSRKASRSRILVRRAVGIVVLTVPGVVLLSAVAGRGTQGSPTAARAPAILAPAHPRYVESGGAGPLSRWPVPRASGTGLTRACQPPSGASDYVNPVGGARVRPERIDQGVDYAGSGTLAALGGARITYVGTTATGWPGSFIEYRLLDGPDAGCYVYYAEGVNPAAGLRVGETVAAGQPIASIIPGWPTGIELGWGAGISTATSAAETHQWSATSDQNSVASEAGESFSALIASLGGPPGKVEG
jgi:hypothetical protein